MTVKIVVFELQLRIRCPFLLSFDLRYLDLLFVWGKNFSILQLSKLNSMLLDGNSAIDPQWQDLTDSNFAFKLILHLFWNNAGIYPNGLWTKWK